MYWIAHTNAYMAVWANMHYSLNKVMKTTKQSLFKRDVSVVSDDFNLYNREVFANIDVFLNETYTPIEGILPSRSKISRVKTAFKFVKHYKIKRQSITLYCDTPANLDLLHGGMAHLVVRNAFETSHIFWLYSISNELYLFKDKQLLITVKKSDYKALQHRFKIEICRLLYQKIKAPWLSVLAGITVVYNNKATMLIGKEGSGKSTLAALLMAHQFMVVSDGLTPFCGRGMMLYGSIGALPITATSSSLLEVYFNKLLYAKAYKHYNGEAQVSYLPINAQKSHAYEAKNIVIVNYKSGAATHLETVGVEAVLEHLVPQSWISHHATSAKGFMAWLQTLRFYKLTYSNTAEMLAVMKQLH